METEKLADTKSLIQTKWNNYCTKEQFLKRKCLFGAIITFNIIFVIVIGIAVYYSGNEVHGKPPDGASPIKGTGHMEDGQNYECSENARSEIDKINSLRGWKNVVQCDPNLVHIAWRHTKGQKISEI